MLTVASDLNRLRPQRTLAFAVILAALGFAPIAGADDAPDPDKEPPVPTPTGEAQTDSTKVAALGRIEPQDGVFSVAGPAGRPAVIAELKVEEGDLIEEGDVIAVLDDAELKAAELARAQATLRNAERHFKRTKTLEQRGVQAQTVYDKAELSLEVAKADLAHAEADLKLTEVRAPTAGEVLQVYARRGERVGPSGIVDLGRTDKMYAVAEVYETDILHVRVGQRATVTSPALQQPLMGTVEYIGRRVGKLDVLSTDPTARTDARVVEVKVRLDDSEAVAGLTNLQVTVEIER